ncbi:pyrimidine reductase family protein [Gordonia sp. NPDC058843]|uniref:pyrimidine reductase family protein n=1 Tax=Gordonia sp. NPDC058843 TaxID=3346648 RepID=UPI00369CC0B1
MFHLQKATQVTYDDELHLLTELYRYPPRPSSGPGAGAPFVRANMVSSIDGAVTYDGKSGGLGGPGDKALFRVLRGLADVILVGAGTATTEGYGQPGPDEALAAHRESLGQAPAPALALVSRSLSVPPDYEPISDPNTVILTCTSAPTDRRQGLLDAGATLVDCGDDTVSTSAILEHCADRGWSRVLCEGGPSLLGSLVSADAVDELCLTTSPHLVGGNAGRIAVTGDSASGNSSASGDSSAVLHALRPASIITDDDGFVFTRWLRHGRSSTR